ncbi:MAG: hypothetical protein M1834_006784 [Cirrosporium novae-zelandiae]|nr:MAG: hypothetical protein M1834_006784 [Cirrosporium novae-zelandiae]
MPGLNLVRPPTPPKDTKKKDSPNLSLPESLVAPPDETPPSTSESIVALQKSQKKVVFSPWHEFHKAPTVFKSAGSNPHLKPLPPSRERKSLKSILKPTPSPSTPVTFISQTSTEFPTFAAMLESIVQQLAGGSRSSKVDAYTILSGSLKTYDDVPDIKAMKDKMGLLLQFLRRDIGAKTGDTDVWDTTLIAQALRLLNIFVGTTQIAELLDDDFRTFMIDHSIGILEEAHIPKIMIRHHMHFISLQKFPSKVITSERAARLLKALHSIEDRVTGNAIIGMRLLVYKRLLTQARGVMITRVSDWMDHLLTGMLSSIRDIRSHAVSMGTEAGMLLGTAGVVSRAMASTLNGEDENGKRFVDFLSNELDKMLSSKEDAPYVPQIWSVIILFLRSRPHQIEHWSHLRTWLHIIQSCFNSGDNLLRFQANLAWNKFVLAINPDSSVSKSVLNILPRATSSQLKNNFGEERSRHSYPGALSSYCNLLYYAFKPTATHADLDIFWDLYVTNVITSCLLSTKKGVDRACQILSALLWNPQPKVWHQNMAIDSTDIKPEDLSRIDCKWSRSRASKVLKVFEAIFEKALWETGETKSDVKTAWSCLTTALGEAGGKEVRISSDCMSAIAVFVGFFQKIWRCGPKALNVCDADGLDVFVGKYDFLVSCTISNIGPVPFIDQQLARISQEIYEPTATPSKTSSRILAPRHTPVIHMLRFLVAPCPKVEMVKSYRSMMMHFLEPLLPARTSRESRVKFCLELVEALQNIAAEVNTFFADEKALRCSWSVVGELTTKALGEPSELRFEEVSSVVEDYRRAIKILVSGLDFDGDESRVSWESLLKTLIELVRKEQDDSVVLMLVIEPVFKAIAVHANSTQIHLFHISYLLEYMIFPQSQHAVDHIRKKLGYVRLKQPKHEDTLLPSEQFFTFINRVLAKSYDSLDLSASNGTSNCILALAHAIKRCPVSTAPTFLEKLQDGISCWITDRREKINLRTPQAEPYEKSLNDLSDVCISTFRTLSSYGSDELSSFTPILLAGFICTREVITNEFITFWNETFGAEPTLQYPRELETVLVNLRFSADIHLPGLEIAETESSEPITFPDSHDLDLENDEKDVGFSPSIRQPLMKRSPKPIIAHNLVPPRNNIQDSSLFTEQSPTPRSSANEHLSRTPTRHLRHDNSQLQFTAIESSPLNSEGEDRRLLTDRQKEVRERQNIETAAMFPDLSSSPRQRPQSSQARSSSLLRFGSNSKPARPSIFDIPSSPALPPVKDGPMNDFIPSSPTPRSSSKKSGPTTDDFDFPSSPPLNGRRTSFKPNMFVATSTPRPVFQATKRFPSTTDRRSLEDENADTSDSMDIDEEHTADLVIDKIEDLDTSAHFPVKRGVQIAAGNEDEQPLQQPPPLSGMNEDIHQSSQSPHIGNLATAISQTSTAPEQQDTVTDGLESMSNEDAMEIEHSVADQVENTPKAVTKQVKRLTSPTVHIESSINDDKNLTPRAALSLRNTADLALNPLAVLSTDQITQDELDDSIPQVPLFSDMDQQYESARERFFTSNTNSHSHNQKTNPISECESSVYDDTSVSDLLDQVQVPSSHNDNRPQTPKNESRTAALQSTTKAPIRTTLQDEHPCFSFNSSSSPLDISRISDSFVHVSHDSSDEDSQQIASQLEHDLLLAVSKSPNVSFSYSFNQSSNSRQDSPSKLQKESEDAVQVPRTGKPNEKLSSNTLKRKRSNLSATSRTVPSRKARRKSGNSSPSSDYGTPPSFNGFDTESEDENIQDCIVIAQMSPVPQHKKTRISSESENKASQTPSSSGRKRGRSRDSSTESKTMFTPDSQNQSSALQTRGSSSGILSSPVNPSSSPTQVRKRGRPSKLSGREPSNLKTIKATDTSSPTSQPSKSNNQSNEGKEWSPSRRGSNPMVIITSSNADNPLFRPQQQTMPSLQPPRMVFTAGGSGTIPATNSSSPDRASSPTKGVMGFLCQALGMLRRQGPLRSETRNRVISLVDEIREEIGNGNRDGGMDLDLDLDMDMDVNVDDLR